MKFTKTWLQSQITSAIQNGDADYLTDLIVRFVIREGGKPNAKDYSVSTAVN